MQEAEAPVADERMARVDLIASAIFIALGVAVAYLSWTMPRLEARGVHPLTVPGLVPGMLGLLLAICGLIVLVRALRSARTPWRTFFAGLAGNESLRASVVGLLVLVYTLGLVDRLPFWAATALFVLAFILIFETYMTDAPKPLLKSLPWAAGISVVTALAVTVVFERAFLVRLP
jgi:putative tricarboxylic transport membrane protein